MKDRRTEEEVQAEIDAIVANHPQGTAIVEAMLGQAKMAEVMYVAGMMRFETYMQSAVQIAITFAFANPAAAARYLEVLRLMHSDQKKTNEMIMAVVEKLGVIDKENAP